MVTDPLDPLRMIHFPPVTAGPCETPPVESGSEATGVYDSREGALSQCLETKRFQVAKSSDIKGTKGKGSRGRGRGMNVRMNEGGGEVVILTVNRSDFHVLPSRKQMQSCPSLLRPSYRYATSPSVVTGLDKHL